MKSSPFFFVLAVLTLLVSWRETSEGFAITATVWPADTKVTMHLDLGSTNVVLLDGGHLE